MAIRMGMDIASFLFSMGIMNCKDYKCYRILPILYWMGVFGYCPSASYLNLNMPLIVLDIVLEMALVTPR